MKSKQESLNEYDGYNYNFDTSRIFKVSSDGEMSISAKGKSIFIERWDQPLNSLTRTTQLHHKMDCDITLIDADFEKDYVVSGDDQGNLMIQRISTNEILMPKTQLFEDSISPISCSSIKNSQLCIGSHNYNIGTIDLNTFTKVKELTCEYDNCVSSVNICNIKNKKFVIATSGKLI